MVGYVYAHIYIYIILILKRIDRRPTGVRFTGSQSGRAVRQGFGYTGTVLLLYIPSATASFATKARCESGTVGLGFAVVGKESSILYIIYPYIARLAG
jgi:hypothetical protein